MKDERYVRSSFDLFNSVNNARLPDGYILKSLDVCSLYTNTPTDFTMNMVKEKWNLVGN